MAYFLLQLATRFDLFQLEVETDSMEAINAINNRHVILANLIYSCRSLMHQKKGLLLRHNFRQGNAVADTLAKEAENQENKQYKLRRTKLFAKHPLFL